MRPSLRPVPGLSPLQRPPGRRISRSSAAPSVLRFDGNDGGQRQRERLVVHRRRSHHDAAVAHHQGTDAETDRFPATAKPRAQSGTGNVQVENEGDGRGVQTVARNVRVHREYRHRTPSVLLFDGPVFVSKYSVLHFPVPFERVGMTQFVAFKCSSNSLF